MAFRGRPKTFKPEHLLAYKCPYCSPSAGVLKCRHSFSDQHEIWVCEKCGKWFKLTFKETEKF